MAPLPVHAVPLYNSVAPPGEPPPAYRAELCNPPAQPLVLAELKFPPADHDPADNKLLMSQFLI